MTAVKVTEAAWQAQVIDAANLLGWTVAHFRPARTKDGWVTPVAAQGKGFPDLFMVRGDRVIAAELKSATGRVTPEQDQWLELLDATGTETYLWRPGDFDHVIEVLR